MTAFDTVVMLATGWGPRHGGINAFNYDLARALHRVTDSKVVVVVPDAANPLRGDGDPELLTIRVDPEELTARDAEAVLQVLGHHATKQTLWIGHDLKSGEAALACRAAVGGKALLIHHMNYEAYYTKKHGDGSETASKAEAQSKLLGCADGVAAVGPRLARSARCRLSFQESTLDVVEIIPGLASVTQRPDPPEDFIAITFGRLNDEDDRIKMGRLAVAAFGRFVASTDPRNLRDPMVYVIGVDDDPDARAKQTAALKKLASDAAGRDVNVTPIPFLTDRDRLLSYVATSSVCMMLSVHEGFGLTGWEAIAASVPLIVSCESGLFDFLNDEGKNPVVGCIYPVTVCGPMESPSEVGGEQPLNEHDIATVAKLLCEIHRDPARAKHGALHLRDMMSKHSWENVATRLARRFNIRLPVPQVRVGLACGFPDAKLYGRADAPAADDVQAKFRTCWEAVGTELGLALARFTGAEIELHHSGIDGGSLAAQIIAEFVDKAGTDRVVTQWHKEFSTEDEALAEIRTTYPNHFKNHNVSSARPYVNKVGTVVHVSTMARRRLKLVSEVDALVVAAGSFAVQELVEHAIERGIPIVLVGLAGGAGLVAAEQIAASNEKVILTLEHRQAIEHLANLRLAQENIPTVVEEAIEALCRSVLEARERHAAI